MNLNLYSYKYTCPRWYGDVEGVATLYVEKNNTNNDSNTKINKHDIEKIATKDANKLSGSTNCHISLLNKFDVSIKSVSTYPSLTGIVSVSNDFPSKISTTNIK